jgi:hypothetical protein
MSPQKVTHGKTPPINPDNTPNPQKSGRFKSIKSGLKGAKEITAKRLGQVHYAAKLVTHYAARSFGA